MSLWRTIRLADSARQVVTPYDNGGVQLERALFDALYPGALGVGLTRTQAMTVPAVARARNLVCAAIARADLLVYKDRGDDLLSPQPIWTYRTDAAQPRQHRLAWTVDDLLFSGESLWVCDRDSEGHVIRVEHVPYESWDVDPDGRITVDGSPVPANRAIHIPGMHEGLLTYGGPAIHGAAETLAAAVDTARHPMRLELHDTGDYPMTRDEVRTLVADAKTAMADNAGVVYTSPGLEARLHGVQADSLLVDGRESFAVDVARLVGIPSAMIDAHARGATMTYSTLRETIASFLHLGLVTYMTPITARLSLDDVTPNGQVVRFDVDDVLAVENLTTDGSTPNEA